MQHKCGTHAPTGKSTNYLKQNVDKHDKVIVFPLFAQHIRADVLRTLIK